MSVSKRIPHFSPRLLWIVGALNVALFAAACAVGQEAPATPPPLPPAATETTGLPPGEGREIVQRVCSGCHTILFVADRRDTPMGWNRKVNEMIGFGASPTPEEQEVIVKYLSENLAKP